MSYEIVLQARPRSRHRDGPGAGARTATFHIGAAPTMLCCLAGDANCHQCESPDQCRSGHCALAVLKRIVWGLPSDVWPLALCAVALIMVRIVA